jgi:hypothetical protein
MIVSALSAVTSAACSDGRSSKGEPDATSPAHAVRDEATQRMCDGGREALSAAEAFAASVDPGDDDAKRVSLRSRRYSVESAPLRFTKHKTPLAPTRVTKCHQRRLHAVLRRQTTSEAIGDSRMTHRSAMRALANSGLAIASLAAIA